MSKIFLFMMVSLDGYFEGENHDLSWHHVDNEFNDSFSIPQLEKSETLLFGRRTYELMASYWPTEEAREDDAMVAKLMNTKQKIVISQSLKKLKEIPHWENISLENSLEKIKQLKQQATKDVAVFGSNMLAVSLLEHNLLDELRIMINPVVIGKGTPLFSGIKNKMEFRLENTRQFRNGNVLLTYTILKGGE